MMVWNIRFGIMRLFERVPLEWVYATVVLIGVLEGWYVLHRPLHVTPWDVMATGVSFIVVLSFIVWFHRNGSAWWERVPWFRRR